MAEFAAEWAMTKWEYQSIRVRATYDWTANETKRVVFEVNASQEKISLPSSLPSEEFEIMVELNRLGHQGWDMVSVNYDRLPDGVVIEYFLKRPIAG